VLDSALWHRPDEIGIRLVGDERGVRQIGERGAIAAIHHDLELEIAGRRCWPGALASRSVTSALAMGAPGGLLALHLRVGGGHHIAEQLDRNDFDAFLVGLLKLAKNLVVDDALARPWSIRLEMTEQETLDMDLVVTVWRRRLLAAMPRIREDDRVTGLSLVDLLPKPRRACPCSHRH
jgi:hypothetical protein